jgi:hypothetical protein
VQRGDTGARCGGDGGGAFVEKEFDLDGRRLGLGVKGWLRGWN